MEQMQSAPALRGFGLFPLVCVLTRFNLRAARRLRDKIDALASMEKRA